MTYRKKKLLIIQICLLLLGIFVILFTYASNEKLEENKIISKEDQKKIEKQLSKDNTEGDILEILNIQVLILLVIGTYLNQKRHLIIKIVKN